MQYGVGFQNIKVLFSTKYNSYAPILYDSWERMPFELANMASGNMGVAPRCEACTDNKIENFAQYYQLEEVGKFSSNKYWDSKFILLSCLVFDIHNGLKDKV